MKIKHVGDRPAVVPAGWHQNRQPRLMKVALGLALGAALLFGVPQAGLAQRGGDHRPSSSPGEMKKQDPRRPDHGNQDRGGRPGQGNKDRGGGKPDPGNRDRGNGRHDGFNKWDKGWQGPEAKRHSNRGRGGGDFRRFDPGIDHSRARSLARAGKLHGYKPLPNSVRRAIRPGRPLPPQARPRPVPEHMRRRLPHHPGYEWRITGRDLVLVAVGSLIVYEIFTNVFD